MAYERYPTRDPRDERSRWRDEGRERGGREDRGFFERAGDEVASWFGDEEAERRRREDQMSEERERGRGASPGSSNRDHDRGYGRDWDRDRGASRNHDHDRDFRDRSWERSGGRGYAASERDYNQSSRQEYRGSRGYRPVTGDYSRGSDQFFAGSAYGREDRERGRGWREREPEGRERSGEHDPHYHSWRERHMSELDRDYDEYRRENQARFERDFASWRERRMQKRGLLDQIREHMEVVGKDDQHVGTIDRVAGDRIVLTRSDPESGGVHHSLSCADIDRVDGDRVVLDLSADQAKQRWRDESRERALFEREDQGEMGPRNLDRSFEGTYR